MLRRIGRADLVDHLGVGLERDEAMGEADGHQHLPPVLRRELDSDEFAEVRRGGADVDRDVEDAPARHADQLVLREGRRLEMQAAQRADRSGKRVVVLHELERDPGLGEGLAVIGLREEAAMVAEPLRRDDPDLRQRGRLDLQHGQCPLSTAGAAPVPSRSPR